MFVIKRYSQRTSPLINFIYTSSAKRCDKPKSPDEVEKTEITQEQNHDENVTSEREKKAKEKLNKIIMEFTATDLKSTDKKDIKITLPLPKKPKKKPMDYNAKLYDTLENLASTLGGDVEKTKSELKESVKIIDEVRETKEKPELKAKPQTESKTLPEINSYAHKGIAEKMQNILSGITKVEKYKRRKSVSEFDTYYKNLGIFKSSDFKPMKNNLKIWGELEEKELKVLATVPPRNHFDELIQWTEEGKIWHFPIDNDQGREEEAGVHFTQHVFLEDHLEPWCPKTGPLRHFMELITVGLSKNHTLTAQDKIDHILWYKEYFEKKKKLLTEVGAFTTPARIEESDNVDSSTAK